jgi:Flp pilus assembly protein TadG
MSNGMHVLRNKMLRRFAGDKRANVAIIFGISIIPLTLLIGMGIDYSRAAWRRTQLDAAADSAVLSALTPKMLSQSDQQLINQATSVFNAEVQNVSGINYSPATLLVAVHDIGMTRTLTLTYQSASQNAFAGILGLQTIALNGTSQASASAAPNVNFYLLLDNSPSMNIAATTAGINTMVANTQSQGGCAFACHESDPAADNLGNPRGVDNYTLAQQLGVVTRIQNMATATQALMTTASATEAASNVTYGMAIYTFNSQGTSTIQTLTSNLTTAQNAAGNVNVLEVYSNSFLTQTNNNNDEDTNFESAMADINGIMPAPGTGLANSTPQEVLLIVSDGVDDEPAVSCSQALDGARCQQPFNTTLCTTVKNRGIRIGVLYTVYLPLPTNAWYNSWIAPFQGQISSVMQNCATPGLFFSVTTDGDITAAMQTLFLDAVATAHLTQ